MTRKSAPYVGIPKIVQSSRRRHVCSVFFEKSAKCVGDGLKANNSFGPVTKTLTRPCWVFMKAEGIYRQFSDFFLALVLIDLIQGILKPKIQPVVADHACIHLKMVIPLLFVVDIPSVLDLGSLNVGTFTRNDQFFRWEQSPDIVIDNVTSDLGIGNLVQERTQDIVDDSDKQLKVFSQLYIVRGVCQLLYLGSLEEQRGEWSLDLGHAFKFVRQRAVWFEEWVKSGAKVRTLELD